MSRATCRRSLSLTLSTPSSRAISPGCGVRTVCTSAAAKIRSGDRVQPIRVDHHGHGRVFHQFRSELAPLAQARTDRHHRHALQRKIVERRRHQLEREVRRIGARDRDQPRTRAQRGQSRHRRGPGFARRSAHHQHVTEIALVRLTLARRRRDAGNRRARKLRGPRESATAGCRSARRPAAPRDPRRPAPGNAPPSAR